MPGRRPAGGSGDAARSTGSGTGTERATLILRSAEGVALRPANMVVEGEPMDATTPLPTGTVTFFFTDIEDGAPRAWVTGARGGAFWQRSPRRRGPDPGTQGGGTLMGTGGGGETRPALPETQARTAAQAEELHAAGEQALRQREYEAASALFEESLAISRQLGHQQGSPDVLEGVAAVAAAPGPAGARRPPLRRRQGPPRGDWLAPAAQRAGVWRHLTGSRRMARLLAIAPLLGR